MSPSNIEKKQELNARRKDLELEIEACKRILSIFADTAPIQVKDLDQQDVDIINTANRKSLFNQQTLFKQLEANYNEVLAQLEVLQANP